MEVYVSKRIDQTNLIFHMGVCLDVDERRLFLIGLRGEQRDKI